MHQPVKNTTYGPASTPHDLWDRVLGLIEQDLKERRSRKLFVEVRDETGPPRQKEIGGSPLRNAGACTRSCEGT
jgi:hypothetical protein